MSLDDGPLNQTTGRPCSQDDPPEGRRRDDTTAQPAPPGQRLNPPVRPAGPAGHRSAPSAGPGGHRSTPSARPGGHRSTPSARPGGHRSTRQTGREVTARPRQPTSGSTPSAGPGGRRSTRQPGSRAGRSPLNPAADQRLNPVSGAGRSPLSPVNRGRDVTAQPRGPRGLRRRGRPDWLSSSHDHDCCKGIPTGVRDRWPHAGASGTPGRVPGDEPTGTDQFGGDVVGPGTGSATSSGGDFI